MLRLHCQLVNFCVPFSLRAPKMANPSTPAAEWAVDARDFLRRLVIGKDVKVQMEYTRKLPAAASGVCQGLLHICSVLRKFCRK